MIKLKQILMENSEIPKMINLTGGQVKIVAYDRSKPKYLELGNGKGKPIYDFVSKDGSRYDVGSKIYVQTDNERDGTPATIIEKFKKSRAVVSIDIEPEVEIEIKSYIEKDENGFITYVKFVEVEYDESFGFKGKASPNTYK